MRQACLGRNSSCNLRGVIATSPTTGYICCSVNRCFLLAVVARLPSGAIPEELGKLTALKTLRLDSNQLTGEWSAQRPYSTTQSPAPRAFPLGDLFTRCAMSTPLSERHDRTVPPHIELVSLSCGAL